MVVRFFGERVLDIMADVEAELQEYLKKHEVEKLLKEIVVNLCMKKPDDVFGFIKTFITEKQSGGAPIGKEHNSPAQ